MNGKVDLTKYDRSHTANTQSKKVADWVITEYKYPPSTRKQNIFHLLKWSHPVFMVSMAHFSP